MLSEPTTNAILASMILSPVAYLDDLHHPSDSVCVEERPASDYEVVPRLTISGQDAWAMLARMDYHTGSTSTHVAFSVTDVTDASEVEDAAALVAELRRLTGLTWAQISQLFGVSKRAPFHWASGKNVSADHHQRLGKVVSLLRYADRGSAEENKKLLLSEAKDGQTFLDLLSSGQDEHFGELAGKGPGRNTLPGTLTPTAKRFHVSQHWGTSAQLLQSADVVEVPVAKSTLRKAKPRRKKV